MKTLYEVCKPRQSVSDESKRDDTLDLSNLLDDSIDGPEFFKETYITKGMELLFDTAFKRFEGKASSGLIKLTQAMGGGKTHNMLALGILARDKKLRKSILNGKYSDLDCGINVVAYTGRESDLEFGIWGEIAAQLGKREAFSKHYSPLSAPGQTAWIKLLKNDTPTLILLDELPPYLQYAKTTAIGMGTLTDVTITALANLFNAIGKAELHNVCIVISDLQATYQIGSRLLRQSFSDLENEIGRSAINIEPVAANTDDLYNILRTRLFETMGEQEDIITIIEGYKKAINEARQMGYTNYTANEVARGIQTSYPFHPSIRDLFARFKENPGFQQTRDYIRLMRLMVKILYTGDIKAKNKYLINAYDMDLNNGELITRVKGIKSSISNAISHDIAGGGNSIAEITDRGRANSDIQDISKLILVSSLANVPNAIIGLSIPELLGYMAEPGKDITTIKQGLEEYSTRAWYLYKDGNNKLYFKDIKNINAELIDLVSTYSYDLAKQEIKRLLEHKFEPQQKDCYQDVLVFPSIEDIDLDRDKITLILTEPSREASGLKKELEKFYEDISYKNRIMFLTGQRNSMDNLIELGKQYTAINTIFNRIKNEEKLPETDPQYKQALGLFDRINLELLQGLRESFVTLYYPKRRGLASDDITMKFEENNFDIEEQIRNLLISKAKFDTDITSKEFRDKLEERVFTQRQMAWSTIKERAATIASWPWHHPKALDDLKEDMLKRGEWIETGGFLDKEPPAPETTVFVREIYENEETGEITLKLLPQNGDAIFYEIEQDATESSLKVEDINNFKTNELRLSFLCIDSKGKHANGAPVKWERNIKLKYRPYDKDGMPHIELAASSKDVKILYTTDGSNPRESGGIYDGEFKIPKGAKFVQAIAVNERLGIYSDPIEIEIKARRFEINKDEELILFAPMLLNNTRETFETLERLEKYDVSLSGINIGISNNINNMLKGYIDLAMGGFKVNNAKTIYEQINRLIDKFFNDKKFEVNLKINEIIFNTGREFERWVSENKEQIDDYKGKVRQ